MGYQTCNLLVETLSLHIYTQYSIQLFCWRIRWTYFKTWSDFWHFTSLHHEILYSSSGKVRKGVGIAATILGGAIGATAMWICSHGCKGKFSIYSFPKNLEPEVIPQMEQQIDAINQYLEISTSELDTLNNNSRCGIVSRNNNLIQILRNKIESLEELKTKVHNTNLIWNRDDPLPG